MYQTVNTTCLFTIEDSGLFIYFLPVSGLHPILTIPPKITMLGGSGEIINHSLTGLYYRQGIEVYIFFNYILLNRLQKPTFSDKGVFHLIKPSRQSRVAMVSLLTSPRPACCHQLPHPVKSRFHLYHNSLKTKPNKFIFWGGGLQLRLRNNMSSVVKVRGLKCKK